MTDQINDLERSDVTSKSSDEPITARGSATPAEHELIVRDRRFDRKAMVPRHWHSNDPVATAWYNSVSASLPRGEAFFIETLRDFREDLPPKLAREIKALLHRKSITRANMSHSIGWFPITAIMSKASTRASARCLS